MAATASMSMDQGGPIIEKTSIAWRIKSSLESPHHQSYPLSVKHLNQEALHYGPFCRAKDRGRLDINEEMPRTTLLAPILNKNLIVRFDQRARDEPET